MADNSEAAIPSEVTIPRTVDRTKIVAACEILGINPAGVRKIVMRQGFVDVTVRLVVDGWQTEDPVPGGDVDG